MRGDTDPFTSDGPETADDPIDGLDPVAKYALEHLGPGSLKGRLKWLKRCHKVLGEEPLVILVPSETEGRADEDQDKLLTILAEQIAREILGTKQGAPEASETARSSSEPSKPVRGQRKAKKMARRGTPASLQPAPEIDGEQPGSISSGNDTGEVLP